VFAVNISPPAYPAHVYRDLANKVNVRSYSRQNIPALRWDSEISFIKWTRFQMFELFWYIRL